MDTIKQKEAHFEQAEDAEADALLNNI